MYSLLPCSALYDPQKPLTLTTSVPAPLTVSQESHQEVNLALENAFVKSRVALLRNDLVNVRSTIE